LTVALGGRLEDSGTEPSRPLSIEKSNLIVGDKLANAWGESVSLAAPDAGAASAIRVVLVSLMRNRRTPRTIVAPWTEEKTIRAADQKRPCPSGSSGSERRGGRADAVG
jgi:hypothetical protein